MNLRSYITRLLPALAAYLLALLLFLAAGENTLVRGLWVLGIVLFIGAHLDLGRLRRPSWPRWSRADGWDIVLLAVITAVGFGLRFWRLTEIPSFLHGDIASQGLQALEVIGSPNPSWFGVGWSNIPMFDFVMMSWSMRIFGPTLFGLSMTSVLQGVATLPAVYLLGREVGGRRAGLVAAALLAISYTHFHFSRIITTASPLLVITLTFYALFRGLRLGSLLWFGLAGIGLGLGLLVYYPIRISVVVVILLFLWLLIWKRSQVTDNLVGWGAFAVASLIGFGPMMGFVFKDFGAFVGRGSTVTISNPDVMSHLIEKYGAATTSQVWIEQFKRSFLTFFLYSDSSTHFGFTGPMLDILTAALFVLGLAFALRWLRDERFFTLVIWITLTLLLGGVITNDPPFWPHLVIVLPAVVVLAGVGADRAWGGILSALPRRSRWLTPDRANAAIGVLLGLAIAIFAVRNWQAYVAEMSDNADTRVRVARFASELPSDHSIVLVSDPLSVQEREFTFLSHGRQSIDAATAQVAAGNLAAPDAPTTFILTPNHNDLLPALQSQYPTGETREHTAIAGWPAFTSFTVTPPGYVPPPGVIDPARALATRTAVVWILSALLLALAAAFGLFLVLRKAPPDLPLETVPPAPSLAPAPAILPVAPAAVTAIRPSPSSALVPVAATPAALARASSPASPPTRTETALYEERLSPRQLALALGGMALALVLAYLGQGLYDAAVGGPIMQALIKTLALEINDRNLLITGTLFYVAAMVLFALAAPALSQAVIVAVKSRTSAAEPRPRPYPGELPPDARIVRPGKAAPASSPRVLSPSPSFAASPPTAAAIRLQLALLAVAFVPYALSLLRFVRQGEDAWVRWLWFLGLLLFLLGQVLWPFLRRMHGAKAEAQPFSPRFHWRHLVLLTLVLLPAFWLRFNHLETIPDDFHGDMASMGLQARDWLAASNRFLFHEGWANIPIMGFLPSAFGLRFFGNNLFGLNMSAVIGGMLTLLALYLLAWRLLDSHRLALLAVAILAVNIPHIHFSRLAAYMDPWPFALLSVFFTIDGLRARRPQSLALAGLLMGFSMTMYYSGRVVLPVLVVAFAYLLLVRREWVTANWPAYALFIAGLFLALGPNLIYFAENREALVERSRAVWLFFPAVMEHLKNKFGVQTDMQVLLRQTKLSLLMFNQSIDSSTQFGLTHPMFSSLLSPLVLLGFGFSLRYWRRPGLGLNLIWLLVMLVNGSIFTGDAPFWPRLVGILPAAALMAAIALERLWAVLIQLLPSYRARAANILVGLLIFTFLAYAGRENWNLYYDTVKNNARSQAFIGRYLYKMPTAIAACTFTDPFGLQVRETYFLAWPRVVVDLPSDAPDTAIEQCPGPPFVWILSPGHLDRLRAIEARWPGGEVQEHFYGNGVPAFTSYLVHTGQPSAAALQPTAPTPSPGEPPQIPPDQPPPPPVAPQAAVPAFPAANPDGSPFQPELTFLGNTNSTLWEIPAGQIEVKGGEFTLRVGPLPGHDAVYDYVELRSPNGGPSYRFEAEDPNVTTGDAYSPHEGPDGHWWLQAYDPFSGGYGLVAHKQETVPVLTTTAHAPDGVYDVVIGSFTGDPGNGIFGLGIRREP